MNERVTENIIRSIFEKNKKFAPGFSVVIYEQSTENPRINKLLSKASKSGPGRGKPEFIVTFPSPYSDLVIIVECKPDKSKHESKARDRYKEYAVDGALLYSSYLSKEYDVISIAVSGIKASSLRISNFIQLKNNPYKQIKSKEILSFADYLNLYLYHPDKEKQSFTELLNYSRELNEHLRDIDLTESHRPLLVSGILIALEDPAFLNSYKAENRPSDLANSLVETITKILDKSNIQGVKKSNMVQSYGFIKTHSLLASDTKRSGQYNTVLCDLISDINLRVKSFTRTYKYYDVLGKFYAEFLRYANGDKTLGIVLTPTHITELFVGLANINENSVVLDNCCGTGGFLIAAMKRMIQLCNGNSNKERKVFDKGLVGIESNSNMFTLACSNMMIRGDGKSNIYYGDCFNLVDEAKKYKPTVGFLNPPYAKKKEDQKELAFVLNNLECLEPSSLCIAIVPLSCALEDPLKAELLEKHTLEAVMSMPEDLFHDSEAGTVTCVMVFRAKIPHEQSNKKTWFGYWRNDGFVKKKKEGRIDYYNRWGKIKEKWIQSFRNREIIKDFSLAKKVSVSDEWCAEAYMVTDYRKINQEDFEKSVKEYIVYKMINEKENVENNE
ncbi:MAG: N-6 DNA methylase [Candidatus Omnitrophota bacterium]|jgi:type I restriction-modification system DNA methylase subunit